MMGRIGILGAGGFGTALAIVWGQATPVTLWGRDHDVMERLAAMRRTPRLDTAALPPSVMPTADPGALGDCDILVVAIPTQAAGAALAALPDLSPAHVAAAFKGVECGSLRTPTAILADRFPDTVGAILSGPSFAADIAHGLPAALSLGCVDDAAGAALQHALSTPTLRLYRTTDVTGVELGGALKNVVAIACGAAIGAGLGESARAACMTRGIAEVTRLATAMGARPETLAGLSGFGDLALTCTSPASRNYALGVALGRGAARQSATAEGVPTTAAAIDLAARHCVAMPLASAVQAVLDGRTDVSGALRALLARDLVTET